MIRAKVKFSNIDVLGTMGQIVQIHTKHFRSDFDIDREMLCDAVEKEEQQDRTFVWLCRMAGTWLLRERDVFLRGTREHNTFRFYMEQTNAPVLAFVVEVTGYDSGMVLGDIFALDYKEYYGHVLSKAVTVGSLFLHYRHGTRTESVDTVTDGCADREYGDFRGCEYQPDSPEKLREALWDERYYRRRFKEGNPEEYLRGLREEELQCAGQ